MLQGTYFSSNCFIAGKYSRPSDATFIFRLYSSVNSYSTPEENFIKRCADTFADERGLVIPLEDSDLIKALEDYPNMGVDAIENILASKYEQIVFEK